MEAKFLIKYSTVHMQNEKTPDKMNNCPPFFFDDQSSKSNQ